MTSLDFLYIALGGGFLILVIFVCVMLLNFTLLLRDFTKISANVREISDRIYEVIMEPLKALSELTAGFGVVHDMMEKIRAKFRAGADQSAQNEKKSDEDDDVSDEDDKPDDKGENKGLFSVKKLGK